MPRPQSFDRKIVLAKARDLFWNKGYNGTSMSDLVVVTGLNRSSIYNSFGKKMDLYKAILIQYQDEDQMMYKDALLRASNPLEAIDFIFQNFIQEILKDSDAKGCFNINSKVELSRSETSISDYLKSMEDDRVDFFKGLVQEAQDARLINTNETPESYAYHLFNTFQGLRTTGMLMRRKEVLQQIVKNSLRVLNKERIS